MNQYYMGVDIGGTTIKFGVFTSRGELVEKWAVSTNVQDNGKHIIPDIYQEVLSFSNKQGRVRAIGMGIPGPVSQDGYVEKCVNLGWCNSNPAKELAALLQDIPVAAGNDANVAALGECYYGAGKGHENIFMVTLGTGVGGGAVINGRIVNGFQGLSGEIGHIPVNSRETEQCNCGNRGCLDQIASASGIVRYTKKLLQDPSKKSLLRECKSLTSAAVSAAAVCGDPLASEALEWCMEYLGKSLSIVSHIIDPELFIIGGGVSKAGPMLIPMIRRGYDKNIFLKKSAADICLASLGGDGGIYGAAKLGMQECGNIP